ncbi:MAG: hypothetical protein H6R05_168 [Burkholderiaceae bacterium]|nr:hypothetical protein [Burkholderiaceae bacterium]
MPIDIKYPLRKVTKEIRLDKLKNDIQPMIAWWYVGIDRKHIKGTQPNIVVGFRKLVDGLWSDEVTHRLVPLTALGQVRLGTVWQKGICTDEVAYPEAYFKVDFSRQGWRTISFQEAYNSHSELPFPQEIHKLKYSGDQSRLLEFSLPNGGKLIVPCLEFFSRCYGRSGEVKRVLATYPWEETLDSGNSRLFSPLNEPEEEGKWKVKLRRRLVNGDIVLLAHAKYDEYTRNVAKSIYAQIEAGFNNEAHKMPLFFADMPPWFEGLAEIKAKGIWFNDNKSFLALRITGCSDPDGEIIERDRENTNKTDAPVDNGGQGDSWDGAPTRTKIKRPSIFDLTSEDDPNFNATPVEIYDDDFIVLGSQREVVDVRKEKAENSAGTKVQGDAPDNYSSAEPYGNNGLTGQASISARPVMDSEGMLSDMWSAMLRLKSRYSNVTSVEWYTFHDGYSDNPEIRLIGLKEVPADLEDIDVATRNWVYSNTSLKDKTRGVLVAKVMIGETPVHFLEIERRSQSSNTEESYRGLVFIPSATENFEVSLNILLENICLVKGVVTKVAHLCPGVGFSFKHSQSRNDQNLCDSALKNALDKVGFKI